MTAELFFIPQRVFLLDKVHVCLYSNIIYQFVEVDPSLDFPNAAGRDGLCYQTRQVRMGCVNKHGR